MATLILEHRRDPEDGNAFKIKLLKCKGNSDMHSQEYKVADGYDFAGLAAEIYPDSSLEDWQ